MATKPKTTDESQLPTTIEPQGELALYDRDATHVPDFMREDMDRGKENIRAEDLETPRLKLMQGLSPELTERDDLRAGNFFHTIAEQVFKGPFRAVPVYMDTQYILWNPRDSGGGILARALDGVHWQPSQGEFEVALDRKDGGAKVKWKLAPTVQGSKLAEWGTMDPNNPNSPPAATLMLNFVLAFPEMPDLLPAVLTFQRSSIPRGRRLNSSLKMSRNPLFGQVFEFSSFVDTNKGGQDFHNINAKGVGLLKNQELYRRYRDIHETFKEIGLKIKDIESVGDEEVAAAAADAARSGNNGNTATVNDPDLPAF